MANTDFSVILDSEWRVVLKPGHRNGNGLHNVYVDIHQRNGNDFDMVLRGQVKANRCCDWGFGSRVIMHFCGRQDSTILTVAFDRAMQLIEESTQEISHGEEATV